MILPDSFFARDAQAVAKELLGKVMRVKHGRSWLSAMIIETEAYYLEDKSSHASLGYTEKRKALFMPPATIYMYYSRGGDSLNISCKGDGNAVLIKAAYPYVDAKSKKTAIAIMQKLNPISSFNRSIKKTESAVAAATDFVIGADGGAIADAGAARSASDAAGAADDGEACGIRLRPIEKLCSGQVLLCRSLGLKVKEWDQKKLNPQSFYIEDAAYSPAKIIQTTRLGIRKGRDEHLMYRFIDYDKAAYCTDNPLRKRRSLNVNFKILM